jgi:molecular chaperone GrpE
MSDQAGPAGQAHPGSDEAEAAAPDERETEAAAQEDALAKMEDL